MKRADVASIIRAQDAGRDPRLLALKYDAMRATPFAFLRATCRLYYARAAAANLLPDAPSGWICGDLHMENFGAFKGENGLAYFDLNDFDEALLAPGTWDILRLATSVMVWAQERGHSASKQRARARIPLEGFGEALDAGRARWMERTTAEGPIRKLLRQAMRRTQQELLDARTVRSGRAGRRLRHEAGRQLPSNDAERRLVARAISRLARETKDPSYFRVIDVARRVAGLGSLGLPRWVVLVEGHGSPDGNCLLDLKTARPSAARLCTPAAQPRWSCEADRVVQVQQWIQAEPPALLRSVGAGKSGLILRELQPQKDRLRLGHLDANPDRVTSVLHAMGGIAGWGLLRGAHRREVATVDAWKGWVNRARWERDLLQRASELAGRLLKDWTEFTSSPIGVRPPTRRDPTARS